MCQEKNFLTKQIHMDLFFLVTVASTLLLLYKWIFFSSKHTIIN